MNTRKFLAIAAAALVAGACSDDPITGGNLAAPQNVTVTINSASSVTIGWNSVSGAESYQVERASCTDPATFAVVTGASAVSGTSFDDTSVSGGDKYLYRVAGKGGDNALGAYSDSVEATTIVNEARALLCGDVTTNVTLSKDTLYVISGYVKVQSGAMITIPAGTKLVGDTVRFGSSLWILRGAMINAQGTAAEPIVFTSQRSPGNRAPGDWGGLVIIGNGIINRSGTVLTEGPAEVAEDYGGGNDNTDNSGTLKYVRIEFSGFDVSGGGGSELNGLSSYAVGSGTTYEYIEVLAGLDDSFEWWGGAVDGRYLISYESGDDHFDTSEGYVGRNQYLIALQTTRLAPAPGTGTLSSDPRGIEADGCSGSGCDSGFDSTPLSDPVFANYTLIGFPGEATSSGKEGARLRRGTRAYLHNGIVGDWASQGITVRDSATWNNGVTVSNVLFAENVADVDPEGDAGKLGWPSRFSSSNHGIATLVTDIVTDPDPTSGLDWSSIGAALDFGGSGTSGSNVAIDAGRTANFFGGAMTDTPYVGAGTAASQWWSGWTFYAQN